MNYLIAAQITLALLLSGIILLQQQGSGIGGAFGGDGNVYRSRRGMEKVLFYATIVIAIAFFGVAIFSIYLSKR